MQHQHNLQPQKCMSILINNFLSATTKKASYRQHLLEGDCYIASCFNELLLFCPPPFITNDNSLLCTHMYYMFVWPLSTHTMIMYQSTNAHRKSSSCYDCFGVTSSLFTETELKKILRSELKLDPLPWVLLFSDTPIKDACLVLNKS